MPSVPPGRRAAAVATLAVALGAFAGCSRDDPFVAGQRHLQHGETAAAVIELRNAAQQKPDDAQVRIVLADALERSYDLAGVQQHLERALELGADADVVAPRLALVMLDRSDYAALLRRFGTQRLADPAADAALRAAVALAHVGDRRPDAAEAALRGLPDAPLSALARAQLALLRGEPAAAMSAVERVAAAPDAPWWLLRGARRIADAAGRADLALDYMHRAQALAPWHRGVVGEYAEALLQARRPDEAARLRDRLRREAPRDYWGHYLDALLLAHAGRADESHAAALRVLAAMPEHVAAALIAASAELRGGDLLMADKRLQALLSREPRSLPALRLATQAAWRLGRRDEAAELLRRGLAVAPDDIVLLDLRAEQQLARGERQAAAATLARLLQLRPHDPEFVLRLARVRAAEGRRDEASRMLETAFAAPDADALLRGRIVSQALRLGDRPLARRLADAGVAAHATDPQTRLTLAAVQSAQGQHEAAWATTLAVLDGSPDLPAALDVLAAMARTPAQRAEQLRRHGAAVAARTKGSGVYLAYAEMLRDAPEPPATPLAVLEQGLKALPASTEVRSALIDELLRAGRPEQAVTTAETGAAMSNATAEAQELLVATYERLGRTPLALQACRQLVAAYPQRADWRFRLARLEAASGDRSASLTLLRALVQERPFDVGAYLALAAAEIDERPNEALSVAREMGRRPELKGAALLLEGDILARTGKVDDALAAFGRAAAAGMTPAANLRAVALLDGQDRRGAADAELASALRRDPEHPAVLGFAADRALRAGRAGEAVELLDRLVRLQPTNPIIRNDLAWAQLQAGRREALDNARIAARALPGNPVVLDTLAMALALAGERDEAIRTLRSAVNLAPTASLPRLHLAELLLAAGDRDGASASVRGMQAASLDERDRPRLEKLRGVLATS